MPPCTRVVPQRSSITRANASSPAASVPPEPTESSRTRLAVASYECVPADAYRPATRLTTNASGGSITSAVGPRGHGTKPPVSQRQIAFAPLGLSPSTSTPSCRESRRRPTPGSRTMRSDSTRRTREHGSGTRRARTRAAPTKEWPPGFRPAATELRWTRRQLRQQRPDGVERNRIALRHDARRGAEPRGDRGDVTARDGLL